MRRVLPVDRTAIHLSVADLEGSASSEMCGSELLLFVLAHDAVTMMIIAKGLKFTPSDLDSDSATGNMNAAVAGLLIRLVMIIVPTKTTGEGITGLMTGNPEVKNT